MGALVSEIIVEMEPLAKERSIQIYYDNPTSQINVRVDVKRISQVLRNLFSNAIKASPDAGAIHVHIQGSADGIEFSMMDEGKGIPKKELEDIFETFVQSSDKERIGGGIGLGLPICREIVSPHNGKIWAENNPEKGAKFTFVIPQDSS